MNRRIIFSLGVVWVGIAFGGVWGLSAQEAPQGAVETPAAEAPGETPAEVPAQTPAEKTSASTAPAANPESEPEPEPEPKPEPTPEPENEEDKDQVRVSDVKMSAVQTLEISEELQRESRQMAEAYVAQFCRNVAAKENAAFCAAEAVRLHGLYAEGGALRRFLANMTILDDPDWPEFRDMEKPVSRQIANGAKVPAEAIRGAAAGLKNRVDRERTQWLELREDLVCRQFLVFEIESNRHIVTQLASMLSVDKRWFWLFSVLAFGLLLAASLHERRHEIRRWLNGGRARQMGLSKVLTVCFCALLAMTLVSFLMGEFLYRAMLDVTFSTTSPRRVNERLLEDVKAGWSELSRNETAAKEKLAAEKKEWNSLAVHNLAGSKDILQQWNTWRDNIGEISVQLALLEAISRQMEADQKELKGVNGKLSSIAGETLGYLRWKHLLRFGLGLLLVLLTFVGIAYYWSEVAVRRKRTVQTCPHCLSEGELLGCDENGNPMEVRAPFVTCRHVLSESPLEECGYRFQSELQPLLKLSFPTLGIPQVGKTHWLTMLYWEVLRGYYPHLGLSCIPSSVTQEMDRRIDEIMNTRIGTAATQRDRIPLPLVLKYRDKDRVGRTELLANLFDYSGEITTDAALDDYRRERALKSDGFFFFLDPTYPWKPQAEALKRFRRDLMALKGLDRNESLHLPIAICLTKIDLLPLVEALGDSEQEAIHFYEELGRIDPTGIALNRHIIEQRSVATDQLRQRIWPDWDVEKQVKDLFGGRYLFFPLTPVGLDGAGEPDLRLRTIAPFGLVEPLAWLLEMSGFPTLEK
ncbi:MAG: hypothetical protein Q4D98_06625 [Planctomycetia bacterium]|nr:hypothetical protein [Planctomycetia bacterium]